MNNISIITISFNNLKDVITTCNSVDIQKKYPFEHLIIDGSTNTEIKTFLEKNNQPHYRRWICEADKGIADAFNKGILNVSGDIIVMMNAGDAFYDEEVITKVSSIFEADNSLQWLHGKFKIFRGNQWVIIGKPFEKNKLYRGMRSVCHQTMYIKKEVYNKHGLYNEQEKIAMDYDFLCRIASEKNTFINQPLAAFAPAGISSTNYLQSLKDNKRVYQKYYGKSFKLIVWQLRLKILYHTLRSPIGNFLYKIKTKLRLENM